VDNTALAPVRAVPPLLRPRTREGWGGLSRSRCSRPRSRASRSRRRLGPAPRLARAAAWAAVLTVAGARSGAASRRPIRGLRRPRGDPPREFGERGATPGLPSTPCRRIGRGVLRGIARSSSFVLSGRRSGNGHRVVAETSLLGILSRRGACPGRLHGPRSGAALLGARLGLVGSSRWPSGRHGSASSVRSRSSPPARRLPQAACSRMGRAAGRCFACSVIRAPLPDYRGRSWLCAAVPSFRGSGIALGLALETTWIPSPSRLDGARRESHAGSRRVGPRQDSWRAPDARGAGLRRRPILAATLAGSSSSSVASTVPSHRAAARYATWTRRRGPTAVRLRLLSARNMRPGRSGSGSTRAPSGSRRRRVNGWAGLVSLPSPRSGSRTSSLRLPHSRRSVIDYRRAAELAAAADFRAWLRVSWNGRSTWWSPSPLASERLAWIVANRISSSRSTATRRERRTSIASTAPAVAWLSGQ